MTANTIKNGNVYDIGQTVNGVSTFLWWNRVWYYFTERMTTVYEYDQNDLTAIVTVNQFEEVKCIGNIIERTLPKEYYL